MKIDKFGQHIYSEQDVCSLYLTDPHANLRDVFIDTPINFNSYLDYTKVPELREYHELDITVDEFDKLHSNTWFIPEEYKKLDIAKWVLEQCKTDEELQRAGEELILYQERNMFVLLRYLKYFVDTMRKHNIVWGVGRGSSIASFVLYLIGIHRVNSLYYDLSITEFLK